MYVVGNFNEAVPDGGGDLIVGTITLQYEAMGTATIAITTIPRFDTWLFSSSIYDDTINSNTMNPVLIINARDSDGDGIYDSSDNCPYDPNPYQYDCDNDSQGDVCDPDTIDDDSDSIDIICDNCPEDDNPDQEDTDSDGIGDVCDNCPETSNPNQSDTDEDGLGDEVGDNCPEDDNPGQEDTDSDGLGDECDSCPEDDNPDQEDTDSDGLGDECDNDDDSDGVLDIDDNCPLINNPDQTDSDSDGRGDLCDYSPYIPDLFSVADGHYYREWGEVCSLIGFCFYPENIGISGSIKVSYEVESGYGFIMNNKKVGIVQV